MSDEPTKEELKDQAREQGLPVSGTKDELKERLGEGGADPQNSSAAFAAKQAADREAGESQS